MKPILFNTDMVRAILDGRKTVTRRVVKPQPAGDGSKPEPLRTRPGYWNTWGDDFVYRQPYLSGDVLYVRETWYKDAGRYMYRADYAEKETFYRDGKEVTIKWKPSIHMPREAARIFLRVKDVRVERLRDITGRQILAEGFDNGYANPAMWARWENAQRMAFADVWGSTIKPADMDKYGWAANPWCWVIEFERISKEEAEHNGT